MKHLCVGSSLSLALAALSYAGSITNFSSRSAFDAAVGANSVETFGPNACFPLSGPLSSSSSGGCLPAILPGVTYSSEIVPGNAFNIDSGGGFTGGFLDSLLLGRPTAPVTITFAGPIAALGFDTNGLMGTSFSIQINFVSGSTTLNPSVPTPGFTFFGFRSDAADIQSVVISGNSTSFGFALDDFAFTASSGAAIPEPASAALILLGLGFLAYRAKSATR